MFLGIFGRRHAGEILEITGDDFVFRPQYVGRLKRRMAGIDKVFHPVHTRPDDILVKGDARFPREHGFQHAAAHGDLVHQALHLDSVLQVLVHIVHDLGDIRVLVDKGICALPGGDVSRPDDDIPVVEPAFLGRESHQFLDEGGHLITGLLDILIDRGELGRTQLADGSVVVHAHHQNIVGDAHVFPAHLGDGFDNLVGDVVVTAQDF